MKSSLRDALAESHVSAVAVALLLLFSFGSLFRVLESLFFRIAGSALVAAVVMLGPPYPTRALATHNRLVLIGGISPLLFAVFSLAAAWLLSRWVYRAGPFRSLARYRTFLRMGDHA